MARMIKRWLNRMLQHARTDQTATRHETEKDVVRFGDHSLARVTMEEWDPEAQQALRAAATAMSNLPFYEGKVHHGYAVRDLATSKRCPRCHADTQQHYADFIYA